jgi:hypothetical protein
MLCASHSGNVAWYERKEFYDTFTESVYIKVLKHVLRRSPAIQTAMSQPVHFYTTCARIPWILCVYMYIRRSLSDVTMARGTLSLHHSTKET